MRLLILTFLLSYTLISSAQERKFKTIKNKFYTEIYSIDKKSNKKVGLYLKIDKSTNDTLVVGNYNNDTKVGLWKFYTSKNRTNFYYDYDKKVISQLPRNITSIDSFYIKKDNDYFLTKVDRAPIYLGYKNEIKHIIWQNAIIPAEIFVKELSGISIASFVIDSLGKMRDIKIERSLSRELDKTIIKEINLINGDWLPARLNGTSIDSKIYILYNVSKSSKKTNYKEKPYLFVLDMVYSYDKPTYTRF